MSPAPEHTSPPAGPRPSVVLVVAMSSSVHTARWLNMVRAPHLRFVVLPVYRQQVSRSLRAWKHVRSEDDLDALGAGEVGVFEPPLALDAEARRLNEQTGYRSWIPSFIPKSTPFAQPLHLMEAIRRFRPSLVHSMEVQMAGYLCLAGKQHLGDAFPPWLLSNWGSDIFLYRKLRDHQDRLSAIAGSIDAYLAECRRDLQIVQEMGFRGVLLPPVPASGGMNFEDVPPADELSPPSRRKQITIKGYHGWSGRALHILAAVRLAAPALRGYTIRVALGSPDVIRVSNRLAEDTGLNIVSDSYFPSHADVLERIGQSRITIGCGISDGISTTLLESMAMGSFPIQSDTSCGAEWVENGRTGFLLSPHDVAGLAGAIERAAMDDVLVDQALTINRATVEERWDAGLNGSIMIQRYRALIESFSARGGVEAGPAC